MKISTDNKGETLELDSNRSVFVCIEKNGVALKYTTGAKVTALLLSDEAMEATVDIYAELLEKTCKNCRDGLNGYKTPDGLIEIEPYPLCEHCYDSLSDYHRE